MNLKVIILIIIQGLVIMACNKHTQNQSKQELPIDTSLFWNFTSGTPAFVSKAELDSVIIHLSDGDNYLFTDMYPVTDFLPEISKDPFILALRLKRAGFKQIESGNGNWKDGPRFCYRKYEKNKLQCQIYKAYTCYESQNDSCLLIAYEQIECKEKEANYYVEFRGFDADLQQCIADQLFNRKEDMSGRVHSFFDFGTLPNNNIPNHTNKIEVEWLPDSEEFTIMIYKSDDKNWRRIFNSGTFNCHDKVKLDPCNHITQLVVLSTFK